MSKTTNPFISKPPTGYTPDIAPPDTKIDSRWIDKQAGQLASYITGEIKDKIEWTPMPLGLISPTFNKYIDNYAARHGVDPAFVALPVLTMAGACIGKRREYIAKCSPFRTHPVIWGYIVGGPGCGKSPLLDTTSTQLATYDKSLKKKFEEDLQKYNQAMVSRGKNPDNSTPPPKKPRKPIFVTVNSTIEALRRAFESTPMGVISIRGEGSGFAKSFGQYKKVPGAAEVEANTYCSLFDGEDISSDTVGDEDKVYYERKPFFSIIAGIQPLKLSSLFQEVHYDCGLPHRFLFCYPGDQDVNKNRKPVGGDMPDCLVRGYNSVMANLLQLKVHKTMQVDYHYKPMYITYKVDQWLQAPKRAFDSVIADLSEDDDYAATLLSKQNRLIPRLATIIACLRIADTDAHEFADLLVADPAQYANAKDDPFSIEITLEDVDAAMHLGLWFIRETIRVHRKYVEESVTDTKISFKLASKIELVARINKCASEKDGYASLGKIKAYYKDFRKTDVQSFLAHIFPTLVEYCSSFSLMNSSGNEVEVDSNTPKSSYHMLDIKRIKALTDEEMEEKRKGVMARLGLGGDKDDDDDDTQSDSGTDHEIDDIDDDEPTTSPDEELEEIDDGGYELDPDDVKNNPPLCDPGTSFEL